MRANIGARTVLFGAVAAMLLGAASPAAAYRLVPADAVAYFDLDGDQMLAWNEVEAAARKAFARLDKAGTGRIPFADVADRLNRRQFDAVNPDHDGTLEIDEWLALARKRFEAADQNRDGKLTRSELGRPAGKALVDLLME